jgi:RHS repeat-associated protein
VNTLNQITQRDVPGGIDVLGAARGTVSVNSDGSGVYRRGEYFRKELSLNNSSAALWQSVSVGASDGGSTNQSGNVSMGQTPELFSYDADGNLTNDGRWAYVWDAENRLLSMTAPASAPSGSRKALHFGYDPKGRRISKVVSNWTGSAWVRALDEKYLYDNWNLIAVLNGTNNGLGKTFLWGTDLSGSMQGAGGVGGLLAVKVVGNSVGFAAYDSNGNVAGLINAADGIEAARYEYGPFGEVVRSSGPSAMDNPFRFSTKFNDDEGECIYYGYRFYQVSRGRWISRDPKEEPGALNLYMFGGNNAVCSVDALGLDYYIVTAPGWCGLKHRLMVGDDGEGGHYTVDFAPKVDHWWQTYRRLCGEGEFNFRTGTGSAKDAVAAMGNVEQSKKTTSEQDRKLAAAAKSLDGWKTDYCLGFGDCRHIDRCVLTRKIAADLAQKFAKWLNEVLTGDD